MQINIKHICDKPIYLIASADERLACLQQTSYHSTTLLMDMQDDRLIKSVMFGIMEGTNRRGKPVREWLVQYGHVQRLHLGYSAAP